MFGELAKNVRRTKYVRRATDTSSPHFHPCSAYKQRTNFSLLNHPSLHFSIPFLTHTPFRSLLSLRNNFGVSYPDSAQILPNNHHKPPHLHHINNLKSSTTKSMPEESQISFRNKVVIDLYFEDMNSVIIVIMNYIAMSGQASHMTIR